MLDDLTPYKDGDFDVSDELIELTKFPEEYVSHILSIYPMYPLISFDSNKLKIYVARLREMLKNNTLSY